MIISILLTPVKNTAAASGSSVFVIRQQTRCSKKECSFPTWHIKTSPTFPYSKYKVKVPRARCFKKLSYRQVGKLSANILLPGQANLLKTGR